MRTLHARLLSALRWKPQIGALGGATRLRSRLTWRRLVRVALFLALPAACLLAWQIRNDLRSDNLASRWGYASHERADRWLPLTRPLLWSWMKSTNEARFEYAAVVFLRQGGDTAHQWMEAALEQNPSHEFPLSRVEINYRSVPQATYIALLDLNAKENLRHFVQLALTNLDVRDTSIQFDASFLATLLTSSLANRTARIILDDMPHPARARARLISGLLPLDVENATGDVKSLWLACRQATDKWQYDPAVPLKRIAAAHDPLAAFHELTLSQRAETLCEPEISSASEQALLERLADDPREPFRGEAAYCLWDILGDDSRLARMLETDLGATANIGQLELLKAAEHHRNSRFVTACRAYGKIRGRTYFHEAGWSGPGEIQARPLTPEAEETQWRQWLVKYPDHPGADDAGFWVGRCLEWQGKRAEALEQFADLLLHPRGDGDMTVAIYDRLLQMLDVGTTDEDLRTFLRRNPEHPYAKSVCYALAVHLARQHDYDEALRLTADLTPDTIDIPHASWNSDAQFRLTGFYDQRRRWQTLRTLGRPDNWRNRFALATAWSREDSWRNGYLMLWNGERCFHYAFARFSNDAGRNSVIPAGYRSANPLVVSLSLLQSVVADPQADPQTVERALMQQITLLADCASYPEYTAMAPLPGFPEDVGKNTQLYLSPIPEYDDRPKAIIRAELEPADWYVRQALQIELTLEDRFPNSKYLGKAALTLCDLTGHHPPTRLFFSCGNTHRSREFDWQQLLDDLKEGAQAFCP